MRYVKNLKFEEEPNYNFLINEMKELAIQENIDLTDKIYDWNIT